MRRARLGVRAVVLSLALALPAAAQSGPNGAGSADEREARALFEQGKQAMSVGRFAEAGGLFERSLALAPRPAPAFNLAVSLRGMGKPKEAGDVLRALLAGKHGALEPERRAEASALLREVAREVARLTISARGASLIEVRIDGLSAGTLHDGEKLEREVNPGERVVTFAARLRETVELRAVVAAGGTASVSAALEPSRAARRASLSLLAEAPEDEVEIVGVARGRGRIERTLDPGKYTLRVTSAEGSRESSIELEPAARHRVVLDSPRESLWSNPWLWGAAALVVVGAGVAGYFALSQEQDPISDPEFGLVQTLRRE